MNRWPPSCIPNATHHPPAHRQTPSADRATCCGQHSSSHRSCCFHRPPTWLAPRSTHVCSCTGARICACTRCCCAATAPTSTRSSDDPTTSERMHPTHQRTPQSGRRMHMCAAGHTLPATAALLLFHFPRRFCTSSVPFQPRRLAPTHCAPHLAHPRLPRRRWLPTAPDAAAAHFCTPCAGCSPPARLTCKLSERVRKRNERGRPARLLPCCAHYLCVAILACTTPTRR